MAHTVRVLQGQLRCRTRRPATVLGMLSRVPTAARALALPAALAAALFAGPATPARAQDPAATTPPAPTVPAGVVVAGVDLSGLSAPDATAKLEGARAQLQRDVVV